MRRRCSSGVELCLDRVRRSGELGRISPRAARYHLLERSQMPNATKFAAIVFFALVTLIGAGYLALRLLFPVATLTQITTCRRQHPV